MDTISPRPSMVNKIMVEFRQKIEKEKNEILSGVKRFSSLGESMQKFINANSKFNTHK